MQKLLLSRWPGDLLALLAGGIYPLAFAPFAHAYLGIISLCLLLFSWQHIAAKRAFVRGGLFGMILFTSGCYWIATSIHLHGNTALPLAILFTGLLILALSAFYGIYAWLWVRWFGAERRSKYLWLFPSLWVLLEWARSELFSGFPWLLLGYSQVDGWFAGFAPLVGVYGISWIVAWCAAVLFMLLTRRFTSWPSKLTAILGIVLLAGYSLYTAQINKPVLWTDHSGEVSVALVQGNIDHQQKWDYQHFWHILDTYESLTAAHWDKDIIIWPENAIPVTQQNMQDYLAKLSLSAQQYNTALLTGIPIGIDTLQQYYNAILVLGASSGVYHKQRLVPFGEFLPFAYYLRGLINFFDIPMSDFAHGERPQAPLQFSGVQVLPFICYEIAYPLDITQQLRQAPSTDLLLNISDTSWFGHSIASPQMLQIARFHALATGRSLLSVTNNGLTAIINPLGEVVKVLPRYQTAVLSGEVALQQGLPPLVRYYLDHCILGGTLLIFLLFLGRRKSANRQ
jgi:apolipoprotein N-acyltransferase